MKRWFLEGTVQKLFYPSAQEMEAFDSPRLFRKIIICACHVVRKKAHQAQEE
jgi:hypothetical protein